MNFWKKYWYWFVIGIMFIGAICLGLWIKNQPEQENLGDTSWIVAPLESYNQEVDLEEATRAEYEAKVNELSTQITSAINGPSQEVEVGDGKFADLTLIPTSDSLRLLADYQAKLGHNFDAIKTLQLGLQYHPDELGILDQLADIYTDLGEYQLAENIYQHVGKTFPEEWKYAALNSTNTALWREDVETAANYYEAYLRAGGENKQEVLDAIKILKNKQQTN